LNSEACQKLALREVGSGFLRESASFGKFSHVFTLFLQLSSLFLHVFARFGAVFSRGFGAKTALALEKRGKWGLAAGKNHLY